MPEKKDPLSNPYLPSGISGPGAGGDLFGGVADVLSGPGSGQYGLQGALSGGTLPQQQGWGIQPTATPFEPYEVPGPQDYSGLAGTNPAMDFSGPSTVEQQFDQNQGFFASPTNSQGYYDQAQNQADNRTQASNRAEEWYQQYPDELASLDPYYDQARGRAMEDINTAMASRGMLRSGAGNQAMVDAMTQLGAEQANREAQHQLQYQGLGGQLARSADISSAGQSQDNLGWLMGLGNVAGQADNASLARIMGGIGAADAATAAKRNRGRDFIGDIALGMGATMPVLERGYGAALDQDQLLLDATTGYSTGVGREGLNESYREQEKIKADEEHGMNLFSNVLGMFS